MSSKKEINTRIQVYSDVILQGVWLHCVNMRLNDNRISRILRDFLSSEMKRNFTRRIDLRNNQLTKIPEKIYQFKRLQHIMLTRNNIKAIGNRQLNLKGYSTTVLLPSSFPLYNKQTQRRLTRFVSLNNNQITEIKADAFEGN